MRCITFVCLIAALSALGDGLAHLPLDIITNNRTKINDKCKIIAITPPENVKRPLAESLPKWYNTDA